MPSLRSSPWILGALPNGLAPLIWRISWRISTVTAGRPQRCFDFHRQYDLNPARANGLRSPVGRLQVRHTSWETVGRRHPISTCQSTQIEVSEVARRSTLICRLSTRISASSATCDRNRSLAIPKINRHKSSIGYQHRAILSQLPARLNLRQGQDCTTSMSGFDLRQAQGSIYSIKYLGNRPHLLRLLILKSKTAFMAGAVLQRLHSTCLQRGSWRRTGLQRSAMPLGFLLAWPERIGRGALQQKAATGLRAVTAFDVRAKPLSQPADFPRTFCPGSPFLRSSP